MSMEKVRVKLSGIRLCELHTFFREAKQSRKNQKHYSIKKLYNMKTMACFTSLHKKPFMPKLLTVHYSLFIDSL